MDELQSEPGYVELWQKQMEAHWTNNDSSSNNLVQHTQCSNMTNESLIRAKPGRRIHLALEKLKMTSSSRPPHRRTILKDWENKCIVATKQHIGIHKDRLHQPQNTNSLRDTRDNTAHIVFESENAVKLHAKDIEDRTCANGNPSKTKSPWGGFTVLDLLTTKDIVLLGFRNMHQWLHHSWILAN